ncbi:MAG: microcin C ABC transporter permease YejB, partial [Amylibacter sp.]|nr:microcin C ABC transporter permease YejB [Amylibacter sp.]
GDDSNNQSENNEYKGARGLPPELIEDLEKQFGFDKPPVERFLTMLWNYIRFDFGESYFRSITIIDLILEKMPVSITLGLWSTLLAYMVSIPLGIRKAIRDGSSFDVWTSGIIIAAYAIPGLLFGILLIVLFAGGSYWQIFPLRGLASEGAADFGFFERIIDYFWHAALPILTSTIAAFATLTLLTKNSFLDEINKQYVMTARAKGLTEFKVFYGHVFRNAMLIVISGFPALFVGIFFGGSLIIEVIFSLDGLGLLGYEAAINRDYQVFFATLYIFALIGLLVKLLSDLTYIWIDPRIDFGSRET